MQTPNEVAAAILVQTLVDHHPQLQADIRQDQPDPKTLAQILAPFYKAQASIQLAEDAVREVRVVSYLMHPPMP